MREAMFTPETLAWLDGLVADNSKEYFTRSRRVYDEHVVAPLQALLERLSEEFGGEPKLFRPHRDIRFSPDKSPYKTNAGGLLVGKDVPGAYYVHLSAEGYFTATGYYIMSPVQLGRYRSALTTGEEAPKIGDRLFRSLEALTAAGYGMEGERLKTLPRGVPKDALHAELLKHKSIAVGHSIPRDLILSADIYGETAKLWRAAAPMLAWLQEYVGRDENGDPRH